ncbi:MAG: response regulator [Dehalococcoidia bacterium]|jgi:CheY-like chemotaxis protein|nr:response regulator [Dehalococcoidia bacterium]
MARILVVDDTPEIRMLLVKVLQRADHEVIEAADGTSVQAWVMDTRPDVIILDLLMPRMDGWETLERLKSDPASRDIPVIISSVLSEDEDLERARSSGAVDYVPKPWTADDLLRRIRWATTIRPRRD